MPVRSINRNIELVNFNIFECVEVTESAAIIYVPGQIPYNNKGKKKEIEGKKSPIKTNVLQYNIKKLGL